MSLEGEEFSSIKRLFDDMEIGKTDVQDGNISVPVYRGTQVDELIDTNKNYDPAFRKLLHQLKAPEEQIYPLPENLQAHLRNYQHTGYQWFKSLSSYHLGGILADDMGLGKTLQSIAYIASEERENPHLIVAPSSVVYNWKNECEKFAPKLKAAILTGIPAERHKKMKESHDADVWITSYATLRQDVDLYKELTFQTMILDEAQYIKNYATKTSKAIRQMKAGRRFALSGTPIENSIDELWAIFQVILPGLLPNQRSFKQLSNEKIARMTKPFILRRLKGDVLKELPEKIESVHVSELTKEQKDLYIGYHRKLQVEAAASMKESGFQQNRMKILAGLTRLRQICCHPSLFIENYEGQSGKLEQLMETVRNAVENGKRMLIFSQFTSMHDIIMKKLEQEDISYFYLHGQTPSKERVEMSDRFNNGENDVFLISLKAGGTGLNLTGADTVILYDLWWNPAVEDQATGRAHRFGQKNVVQVIRLITEGTIEEKIYELQQKKRELIDQVIQPGETMLSSLSEEDVRELLSI
jgi:SNF2 family DNA or RNA helicase